jgi:DNA-binding MarR family transcriptional regulator
MTKHTQFTQAIRTWMDISMNRSWRGWSHFAKSTGLSMPQFSIMMQLHYRGTCGVSDISDRFEVTNAAASQLVEKLVQSGYLERAEDPSDRRAKLVTLSRKGKLLVGRGVEERFLWLDQLETGLSAAQRDKVRDGLMILTEVASKLDQSLEK